MTADSPTPRQALPGVARSIGEVHALLLLLTLLYFFVAPSAISLPTAWFAALACYAGAVFAVRGARTLRAQPRARLTLEATAMVALITALLALSGGTSSPLDYLYLLPVILTALAVSRTAALLQLVLIVAGRCGIGYLEAGDGWWSLRSLAVLFAELAPLALVAFLTSTLATELTQAARRIRSLADRDHQTGLLNMRSFFRVATEEVRALEARGDSYAVLMVDVDGLRDINDRFGHGAGDRALQSVADAVSRATRGSDTCARYGGDEFIVALPGAQQEAAEAVANRIRHNVFAATQDFNSAMRRLAVSIGIALYPADGRDLRSLIRAADRAMYRDQTARRAREQSYLPASVSAAGGAASASKV